MGIYSRSIERNLYIKKGGKKANGISVNDWGGGEITREEACLLKEKRSGC